VPHPQVVLTCDTAGIISPAPFIIGSLQTAKALKILVGAKEINRNLIVIDVWKDAFHQIEITPHENCPACQGKYEFLEGKFGIKTTSLCGQNAVQVLNPKAVKLSFDELAARLKKVASEVSYNEFMLHFTVDSQEMVIFPDGRAIVKNTNDDSLARGLYAKYIGA
jgi:adenylyltransferase/sulfurtransferase